MPSCIIKSRAFKWWDNGSGRLVCNWEDSWRLDTLWMRNLQYSNTIFLGQCWIWHLCGFLLWFLLPVNFTYKSYFNTIWSDRISQLYWTHFANMSTNAQVKSKLDAEAGMFNFTKFKFNPFKILHTTSNRRTPYCLNSDNINYILCKSKLSKLVDSAKMSSKGLALVAQNFTPSLLHSFDTFFRNVQLVIFLFQVYLFLPDMGMSATKFVNTLFSHWMKH